MIEPILFFSFYNLSVNQKKQNNYMKLVCIDYWFNRQKK